MDGRGGRGGRGQRLLELGHPAVASRSDTDGGARGPVVSTIDSGGAGARSEPGSGSDGKGISVP